MVTTNVMVILAAILYVLFWIAVIAGVVRLFL